MGRPTQPVGCRHRTWARRAYFFQVEGAAVGAERQEPVRDRPARDRAPARRPGGHARRDDAEEVSDRARRRGRRCAGAGRAPYARAPPASSRDPTPASNCVGVDHLRLVLLDERRPLVERPPAGGPRRAARAAPRAFCSRRRRGKDRCLLDANGPRRRALRSTRLIETPVLLRRRPSSPAPPGRRRASAGHDGCTLIIPYADSSGSLDQRPVGPPAGRPPAPTAAIRSSALRPLQLLRGDQLEPELARTVGDRRRGRPAAAALGRSGGWPGETGRCALAASRSTTTAAKLRVPR